MLLCFFTLISMKEEGVSDFIVPEGVGPFGYLYRYVPEPFSPADVIKACEEDVS